MKQLAAFLLCSLSLLVNAQTCIYQTYPNVGTSYSWMTDAKVRPDGGIMGTVQPDGNIRNALVRRIDPNGQIVWDQWINPVDPRLRLSSSSVSVRGDASVIVFGTTNVNYQYQNEFAAQVDSSGQVQWARLYMLDSAYQGLGGYPGRLDVLADGSMLIAMSCGRGLSVSKLDASGIPIWSKRYETDSTNFFHWMVGTIEDPDGHLLIIGYHYGGDYPILIHTDAQGQPDWDHVYDLGGVHPTSAVRCANGDYVLSCAGGLGACLVRISSTGVFQWMKRYGTNYYDTKVGELSNGDLLLNFSDSYPRMIETDGAGVPVAAWSPIVADEGTSLIGLKGDSIYVVQNGNDGNYTGVMISSGTSSLSCTLTPATTPGATTLPGPLSVDDSLVVVRDSLKTWTMNIAPILGLNQLDIQADVAAGPARPGFDELVYTTIHHEGGATSGPLTATLTFDPQLSFVDASPAPTSVVGNVVTWSGIPGMGGFGFQSRSMYTRLNVPAALPIGTNISSTLNVAQDSVETDLSNNTSMFSQLLVGSFDPNDKTVRPADYYNLQTDSILDYTIQFQNTGNDTAFTVVVRDTLPLDVDTRTFEPGAASHPYTYSLTGNGILTFTFDNILLPDSNVNEPLSHGLINFRIRPILPLMLGTTISNVADIFFDLNAPVRTPAATVVVTDALGMVKPITPEKLGLFPVPAKDLLNVILPPKFTVRNAYIMGVDGRHVPIPMTLGVQERMSVPVQHLASGAYVLTVFGADGRRLAARFTKE